MPTYDELHEQYRTRFSHMSLTAEGLRYLKVRTLVDRPALVQSDLLRDFLGIQDDRRSFNWSLIHELRTSLFQNEQVTSPDLDHLLRQVYHELQEESGIDYDRLEASLVTLSQEGDPYWEAWNSVYRDDIRQHIQHRFVRTSAIRDFDELLMAIDEQLNPVVKGYTIISWYNQWTSAVIERMILSHHNVVPTVRRIDKVDFFFQGIPFDLKVTFLPRQYIAALRRQGIASTPLQALDHLIRNPLDLSKWLYENQGERRFSDSHRFFLVFADRTDLERSWKLKAAFDLVRPHLNRYFEEQAEVPQMEWQFEGDAVQGRFQTFTDVLPVVHS